MDASQANVPGSSIWSLVFNKYSIGVIFAIIGVVLLGVENVASGGNDTVKQNYIGGGVTFLLVGLAVLFYTTGLFDKAYAFSQIARGNVMTTILLILVITISIFVALFYNYSPSDVIPFSSAVLVGLSVIGIIGLLYVFSGKQQLANVITRFSFSLYFFIPYALFTFGIVVDMLTRSLQYTPASFAGLTGILINFATSLMFTNGVVPPVTNALCEIPGLSQFSSAIAPQSMMFSLSILAYIAAYTTRMKGGSLVVDPQFIWPPWAMYFGLAGLHYVVLGANGCLTGPKAVGGLLFPLAWGGIIGLIGSTVLKSANPTTPTTPTSTPFGYHETRICKDGSIPGINGKCPDDSTPTTSTVGTCSAGSGDGEFVCESFKNGKLETKVMTE